MPTEIDQFLAVLTAMEVPHYCQDYGGYYTPGNGTGHSDSGPFRAVFLGAANGTNPKGRIGFFFVRDGTYCYHDTVPHEPGQPAKREKLNLFGQAPEVRLVSSEDNKINWREFL